MFVDTQETAFLQDLSKPSLEALSHILRHTELWPVGFEWDYSECEKCAMGLAGKLWRMFVPINPNAAVLCAAEFFGITGKVSHEIFGGYGEWIPYVEGCQILRDLDIVTPEMVADQIDKHLRGGE